MANVLIVDDDDDLRELLAEFLAAEGHLVERARNGEEGLRHLARYAPDAIILDVEMPILDGPSMAYRMLLQDAGIERIPVLLFSGGPHVAHVARVLGTPYYLPKPALPDAILKTLSRVLVERAPMQPEVAGLARMVVKS